MDFKEYEIGERQVREFALNIFADIDDYIQTHEQEFQEFLKKEGLKENNDIPSKKRNKR